MNPGNVKPSEGVSFGVQGEGSVVGVDILGSRYRVPLIGAAEEALADLTAMNAYCKRSGCAKKGKGRCTICEEPMCEFHLWSLWPGWKVCPVCFEDGMKWKILFERYGSKAA